MHDIVNNIRVEQLFPPQTIQSTALNSGNIDCRGFSTMAVILAVGNIADTLDASHRIDVKIEHADDDGTGSPASYAACGDEDVLNASGLTAGLFLSIDATDKEQARHVIGYRGGKRFVKVTATPVSLTTGGPVAMLCLKGSASVLPVANT